MWDLIVSAPDHCLSFYFKTTPCIIMLILALIRITDLTLVNVYVGLRWQRGLVVRYNVGFLEQNGCTH